MRGTRAVVRWLGALLLAMAGCQSTDPPLKPNIPDEYILPPRDDRRFSSPPEYPKETLDSGMFKKEPPKPGDQTQQPARFGPPGLGTRGMGGY